MIPILIGLLANAESVRPGIQLPKFPVLFAVFIAFAIDLLVIATLTKHLLWTAS
jgi:hypothetical protein